MGHSVGKDVAERTGGKMNWNEKSLQERIASRFAEKGCMRKLSFKKWWMYLFPSLRRWLRECEEHLNSKEVRMQYDGIVTDLITGVHIENVHNRPPGIEKFQRNRLEIVDYFKPGTGKLI